MLASLTRADSLPYSNRDLVQMPLKLESLTSELSIQRVADIPPVAVNQTNRDNKV